MAISEPNITYDGNYTRLCLVSPDNNIWEIRITDGGTPNIIDTETTYVPGIGPPITPISTTYETNDMKLLLVSPNNNIWEIQVADTGIPTFIDTTETFDDGGIPIPDPPYNNTYATDYNKLLLVSPNNHIWEITVTNEGNPQMTDTGQIYS